jgi:hypothetical protein
MTEGKKKAGGKKKAAGSPDDNVPYNVRMPRALVERLGSVAKRLGVGSSALLRMILVETLPAYERRARVAEGGDES